MLNRKYMTKSMIALLTLAILVAGVGNTAFADKNKGATVDDTQAKRSVMTSYSNVHVVDTSRDKYNNLVIDANQEPISDIQKTEKVTVESRIYTVRTKALSVRHEPSSDSDVVMFEEMTPEEQEANGQMSAKGDAYYRQGYTFTGEDLIYISDSEIWVEVPSGYVCMERAGMRYLDEEITQEEYEVEHFSGGKIETKYLVEEVSDVTSHFSINIGSQVSYQDSYAVILDFTGDTDTSASEETETIISNEIESDIDETLDRSVEDEVDDLNIQPLDEATAENDAGLDELNSNVEESEAEDTNETIDQIPVPSDEMVQTEEMLTPSDILGEALVESETSEITEESLQPEISNEERATVFSEEDVYLLAQLMYNEAIGEGTVGQMAVAEVVLNRVNSSKFPDTVRGVIYSPGQFANNEAIKNRRPSDELVQLADSVLNGGVRLFNNPSVLFFRNANGYTGDWGRFPHYATVNHHEFYLG